MFFGLSTKALSAIAAAVVLTGVVVGTAAVMADGDDFGTIGSPDWESGYAWTYDVTGQVGFTVTGDEIGSFGDEFDFGTLEIKKEILNTQDFSHDGDDLYVGATTLPLGHILDLDMFAMEGGGWADLAVFPTADRQRDLAPVPAYPVFTNGEATDVAFADGLAVDYIQFPLEHGKRWDDTVSLQEKLLGFDELEDLEVFGDITELQLVGEVGTMETLELPIGDVDAVRIDFSYKPIGLQRAVAQFREEAESYGVTFERLNVQIGLHEIAHYSPAHEAVVRDQYIFKALADISMDAFGEQYDMYFDLTGYVVAEMTGSTLAMEREHDLDAILDILNGRDVIRDAEGVVIQEEDLYQIDLKASTDRVNAAASEVVRFDIVNDAVGGLPDGHHYEYVVVDGDGRAVDVAGTGSQFDIVFSEPGSYQVLVASVDGDGNAITQDSAVVYADYLESFEATCPVVASVFTGSCGDIAVPARTGLERAVLTAFVNQTLLGDPAAQNRILFEDVQGRDVYGYQVAPGEYRIELDQVATGAEDGMLTYMPLVASGDTVTFVVDLTYGRLPHDTVGHYASTSAGGMALMGDAQFLGPMMGVLDQTLVGLVEGDVGMDLAPLAL